MEHPTALPLLTLRPQDMSSWHNLSRNYSTAALETEFTTSAAFYSVFTVSHRPTGGLYGRRTPGNGQLRQPARGWFNVAQPVEGDIDAPEIAFKMFWEKGEDAFQHFFGTRSHTSKEFKRLNNSDRANTAEKTVL